MFSLSLSSDIYKVKISTYKKITLKFFALSLALARAGTIFPVIREITLIKKHIILESNLECAKVKFIQANFSNPQG